MLWFGALSYNRFSVMEMFEKQRKTIYDFVELAILAEEMNIGFFRNEFELTGSLLYKLFVNDTEMPMNDVDFMYYGDYESLQHLLKKYPNVETITLKHYVEDDIDGMAMLNRSFCGLYRIRLTATLSIDIQHWMVDFKPKKHKADLFYSQLLPLIKEQSKSNKRKIYSLILKNI